MSTRKELLLEQSEIIKKMATQIDEMYEKLDEALEKKAAIKGKVDEK
jgi:uncharacterized coiled-coil protein SlyX